jgi:hypothetical protein
MSRAARAKAEASFAVDRMVENMLAVYDRALGAPM